jgi:hypothetical protein
MSKKTADLSSSLVAVKGKATAPIDATGRQPEETSRSNMPLNFKVEKEFRQRFRQRAFDADLKLNQLLHEALDAWEEKRGIR